MKNTNIADYTKHKQSEKNIFTASQIFISAFLLFKTHMKTGLKKVILSLLFLLIAKITSVFAPVVFKLIIDFMNTNQSSIQIIEIAAFYCITWMISGVLGELKEVVFSTISQRTVNSLYTSIFDHIQTLGMDYHAEKKTYEVVHKIQTGVKSIERFLVFLVLYSIPLSFEFIAVIFAMLYIYPLKYSAILTLTLISYSLFVFTTSNAKLQLAKKINESDNLIASKMTDSMVNFELVKYFGAEKSEVFKLKKHFEEYEHRNLLSSRFTFITNMIQHIIISSGFMIFTVSSANDAVLHNISVGDFILLNSYMIQLSQPLKHLGLAHREIKTSLANMMGIISILNKKPTKQPEDLHQNAHCKTPDIVFKNVYFEYTEGISLLKDISFSMPYGTKTAIVGESGSGKSTLAKLILNSYMQKSGEILIGNVNIISIDREYLTKLISFIPQESLLFDDTIEYNLTYGNKHTTCDEFAHITNITKVSSFVERMPDKYATLVGEKGIKISHGEKQRISIARTLLKKDAKIVIADEPTSALDNQTAAIVENAIKTYSKDKTLILISHSISSVVDFDQILVMNKGKIEAIGTHSILVAKNNLYRKLYEAELSQTKM